MNIGKVASVGAAVLGTTVGVGSGVAGIKLAHKITGKPVGLYGTPAHLLTNDKVEDKFQCMKDQTVNGLKTNAKVSAITLAGAGAGVLASKSNTVKSLVNSAKEEAGKLLSKVSIGEKGSLKEIITKTKAYQKINSLPAPAKAAALGALAVLSVVLPSAIAKSTTDAAAIEAKHEGCVA